MGDDETGELRAEQSDRERAERELARESDLSAEERAHRRRAEKAAYLKEKLDERAESEERVDEDA
jgi:hypothetical protein